MASWRKRRGPPNNGAKTPSEQAARDARAQLGSDPFRGARERRVADPEITESQMQVRAARDAIERAGIEVGDIDLCLTASSVPDHLTSPDVCIVHKELGLPRHVLSLQIDNACASFVQQLEIARGVLRPGGGFALLTQGCMGTRFTEPGTNHEPWFGDGATAVIVGPCGKGEGLLGFAHATHGATHEALVTGVRGGTWKDNGVPYLYLRDVSQAVEMFANVCTWGKEMTEAAREDAGIGREEIDFFACHQGQAWLRPAVQQFAGLEHAKSFDTFADFGSLAHANIPLLLRLAADAGKLVPGDIVQAFTGGAGETFASVVFRW